MNRTQNYQLNQWKAEDRVLRADFNADNQKIDAALKEVDARADALDSAKADKAAVSALQAALNTAKATIPKIVTGTYTGNGAESRTISLGFTPKAVLLFTQQGSTYVSTRSSSHEHYGGLAVTGSDVKNPAGHIVLAIKSGGFQVANLSTNDSSLNYYAFSNMNGKVYHYLAIG